jgi:hypothetical protein
MNNDNNSLERRIVFFSIQNGQAPFPLGWGWLYFSEIIGKRRIVNGCVLSVILPPKGIGI